MPVRNRAMELLLDKQSREQRKIQDKEFAAAIKLSPGTVSKWMNNEITQFNGDTIDAMCRFFNCQIGDLLVLVDDNGTPQTRQD